MFKSKHVFTCPDVIYLMKKQKKLQYASLGVYGTFFGGLAVAGAITTRNEKRRAALITDTPDQ